MELGGPAGERRRRRRADVPARASTSRSAGSRSRDSRARALCRQRVVADLKLALTEACSNSVRHAYEQGREGVVEVLYELSGDRIAVEVTRRRGRLRPRRIRTRAGGAGRRRARHRDHPGRHRRARDRARSRGQARASGSRSTSTGPPSPPLSSGAVQLQQVNVGHKALSDYATIASRGVDGADLGARRAACRQARPPSLGDRVRRRRRGDPLHARPTHARCRAWTPSGASSTARTSSSTSPRRSTTRSRGRPDRSQRTSRRSSVATTSGTRRRSTDSFDFVIVHDPQPAGVIDHARAARPPLDLALPHRSLHAERGRARVPAPLAAFLRRDDLPPRRVRPAPRGPPAGVYLAAGDRPADAEEHGAFARGCVVHRRPIRDRRRPPARHPGLPLRSLEGPGRRDRGLAEPA